MSPYGNNAKNRRRSKSTAKATPSLSIRKGDLKAINECLDLGIPLDMNDRGSVRRFTAGQITDRIIGKLVETTHRQPSLTSNYWLDGTTIRALAEQAREKIAQKETILAKQKRDREEFHNR